MTTDGKLRVAVLFSGSASGFQFLAEHDPYYSETYEIVGGVASSESSTGISAFRNGGLQVEINDIDSFYADRDADKSDLTVREAYDDKTRDLLSSMDPDIVLLSGYMWIVTEAVFEAFPTINVHPADLTITDETGNRRYVGYKPVKDAIVAGESVTRSTVHFVTRDVDEGPLLVRSRPFSVHEPLVSCLLENNRTDCLDEYVAAHQEWMKWEGDGPSIAKAIELLAAGRVNREQTTVDIDGTSGFYDLGQDAVLPEDR